MKETWDLYDENKDQTGETCLRENKNKIPDGRYHLAAWVYTMTSDGKMLLTQRASGKSRAFLWEPVGGCVQSSETSKECAVREVEEEISLTIEKNNLELFFEKR